MTIIKNSIAKGASDDELKFLLTVARRYKLDPFKKQIWFVKRWDKNADNGNGGKGAYVWTPQVGIDGLLFTAARDHKSEFGSVSLPEFGPMAEQSFTYDGKTAKFKAPEWVRVKVWKKGEAQPTEVETFWEEYVPRKLAEAPFWRKMPRRMLAKCAIALAIRQAYPDLGGLYIPEECDRMNDDVTPGGRQIVEVGNGGTREAAQAVGQRKLKQMQEHKAEPEPKRELVKVLCWVEGNNTLLKDLPELVKTEFIEAGLGLKLANRGVWMVPGENAERFEALLDKHGFKLASATPPETPKPTETHAKATAEPVQPRTQTAGTSTQAKAQSSQPAGQSTAAASSTSLGSGVPKAEVQPMGMGLVTDFRKNRGAGWMIYQGNSRLLLFDNKKMDVGASEPVALADLLAASVGKEGKFLVKRYTKKDAAGKDQPQYYPDQSPIWMAEVALQVGDYSWDEDGCRVIQRGQGKLYGE